MDEHLASKMRRQIIELSLLLGCSEQQVIYKALLLLYKQHDPEAIKARNLQVQSKLNRYQRQIYSLLEKGLSQKEIAERYHCAPATLCRWLKKRKRNESKVADTRL